MVGVHGQKIQYFSNWFEHCMFSVMHKDEKRIVTLFSCRIIWFFGKTNGKKRDYAHFSLEWINKCCKKQTGARESERKFVSGSDVFLHAGKLWKTRNLSLSYNVSKEIYCAGNSKVAYCKKMAVKGHRFY